MTLTQMFKKIESYNELAELMNSEKAYISFENSVHTWEYYKADNAAALRKELRRELIEELAEAIIKYPDYKFDQAATITFTDRFGVTKTYYYTPYLCAR